ncbi:hypothetical protein AX769_00905 [Frondihabitans sp. PAMC 28766]|uniref:isopeptide-forming domain-containing fimbrial protein n=1 Tax=Frondihabitans sp. PAMC 28766 TaxID=1795630 RepID=UPI00078E6B45|nr:isopeptide-forming domain-containing fimbrial protein [Frondihabitans sp. PAMC 28766]AMM18957.1 hypothetical protein AX769_00905 [Frondihabitans sp. PAMC 28766]
MTFPATYDSGTTDQTFAVQVTGLEVDPATSLGNKTNTATFTSNVSSASGAAAVPPQTASKTIAVVAPVPTLTKTASPSTNVAAGQSITFALTAGNTAGSPSGYDSVIVDCLPAGLTYQSFTSTTSGVTLTSNSPGDQSTPVIGTSELCLTGTTRLVFSVGTLAPGASTLVDVVATVNSTAVSSDTYTNTAKVVTSTLSDGVRDSTVEGVEAAAAQATVTVVAPTVTKTVSAAKVPAGGSVSYTISSGVPANVTLYDPTITDQLPAGMTLSGTATCTLAGSPITCTPLTTTTAGNRTTIGWTFPQITSGTATRPLTVTFAVQLSTTVSTARGTALANTAILKWNASEKGAPTSVTATFDRSVTSTAATTTVTTPAITVAKTVTPPGGTASGAATPKPGDVFTYAVTATNPANANASAAYDTVVTDVVPNGVIVDPTSLASNGSLSGQTATGGGTITWSGVTIAASSSKTYTYSATFADSTTLHTAALTNTANVASYNSVEGAGVAYGAGTAATAKVTPSVPNVTLRKSAAAGTLAYVGQPFPWRVVFTNTGAAATTLAPTDTLPANWTYVPGSATYSVAGGSAQAIADPTVTTAGGVQTLAFGNLGALPGAGTTSELDYQAVPASAATQTPGTGASNPHVNSISAVSTDPTGATHDADGSYTGPAATASAEIDSADVAIVKTADQPLVAGTTVSAWKLTVSNKGGDTAVGPFTVTDSPTTLPADVTITGASGTGWSCTTPNSSGSFTCTRTDSTDTLADGASFPAISVTAATDSDAPVESVTNSASVIAKTFDPDTTDNTSAATVPTVQQADLAVTKSVGSVHAGSTATWQIGVSNLGPSTSRAGITVTDPIPSGVSEVAASGPDWACTVASSTVTCTLTGDLAAGTPAPPILLTGTVASSFTGTVSNTATVTGVTADPNPLNNSATASATVDTATTLSVAKTLLSSTVEPGSDVGFQVAVTNTGTADARHVSITDPLPDGLTYVSSSSTTGTWSCSETSTTPSTATCDLQGTLSAGAGSDVATVVIVAHVPADVTTSITNVATAHSDNAPDSSGNYTNGSTPRTVFSLSKTHPAGDIRAGQDVAYTLTATNDGPSDAPAGTTVTDTLPAGLTYSSATGDGWDCSAAGQVVTCATQATADVGVGFPAIAVIASTDPTLSPGTYTNTASVTGPGAPSTVDASDPTVITTAATLHVDKAITSGSTITAGTLATYDVTVTNDGPSAARSVTLADVTPVGMTVVSISGDGWTCDDSAGSCSDAIVPPGATTLHVTARVGSSVLDGTVLTNQADLAWTDTQGSYTASSTADVTVAAAAALALTKTAVDSSGNPIETADGGDLQRYALVATNTGPSDAVGPLRVVDTLPAGLSYVSSDPDWTCAVDPINSQIVDCALADGSGLVAGGTAPLLTLTTRIAPDVMDATITNEAALTSGTAQVGPEAVATSTITVGALDDLSITKTHTGSPHVGDALPFRIGVVNHGPSDATGVAVQDVLPVGLDYVSTDGSDSAWTCTVAAATGTGTPVTCVLSGTLDADATAPALSIITTVTAKAYPGVTNTATVTSTTADSDPSNNSASDPITVPALSSLSITKTHRGTAARGHELVYVLTVTNTGPTADPGRITVTDPLPAGLSFVSASPSDDSCRAAGAKVTCVLTGDLAVGQSRTILLTTLVADNAPGSIVNTASVSSPTEQVQPPAGSGGPHTTASNSATVAKAAVSAAGAGSGSLAFTGSQGVGLTVTGALAAIVAGFILMLRRRRRLDGNGRRH